MAQNLLMDKCKINTNFDTDKFVGIKAENGDISIHFPLGFHLSNTEKEVRRDILLLLNVLSKHTKKKESKLNLENSYNFVEWPIQAYLFVISDYYARGYYKEKETIYEKSKKGKINWGKTVKTQKAYIQGNEVFYLDFITRKSNINENELITQIHEYCVYESFNKIGWLFTSGKPKEPRIKFKKKLFLSVVKNKMSKTFNDKNKQLFKNMLLIIESLGDDGAGVDYKYGTYRFEYVWESMIDKVYGIDNKSDYFPKTRWKLKTTAFENASLEPDTIMLINGKKDKVYVLDAKYYKFGQTKNPKHLPESTSINKQITYGEYIAENEKFQDLDGNNPIVYNAFLMPYDAEGKAFKTNKELFCIGIAESDWKYSQEDKEYEDVVGILLDVRSIMEDCSFNSDKIIELANLIENNVTKKS